MKARTFTAVLAIAALSAGVAAAQDQGGDHQRGGGEAHGGGQAGPAHVAPGGAPMRPDGPGMAAPHAAAPSGPMRGDHDTGGPARQFSYQGHSHAAMRGPSFHYPRGYSYRRWGVGQRLPSLFLSSIYFFDDYGEFGFGPPPFGDRWVRYGPDLLLVEIGTGRVVDVVYGAFY